VTRKILKSKKGI
jgi:hypothetical protein